VVAQALEDSLKKFKTQVYVLESDREFLSKPVQDVCKRLNIYYKSKFGKNKAVFAERYMFLVKRKLYMLLRSKLSKNWIKYIQVVAKNLNNLPIKKLGFLKPNDITSEKSSVFVHNEKEKYKVQSLNQPTFKDQQENQAQYEQNEKHLQKGDYVYKQFDVKMFDKKYNIAVKEQILL